MAAFHRLGPYTDAELLAARTTYVPWITGVFQRDLLGTMTPSRRASIGAIGLEMPDQLGAHYGTDPAFALNIGADPHRRMVILPVRTAKWIDEFSSLFAWLQVNHPDKSVVLALLYANMLVSSQPSARPPGPMSAFGLTAAIYGDAVVKDLSNKILNGALTFFLLHELGHLALNHSGGLTGIASQQQEREADGYALDAMAETHILPLGVYFLFLAAAMMERGQNTHPQSGERIAAAGQRLQTNASRFVDSNDLHPERTADKLRYYGQQLCQYAPLADAPQRRADFLSTAAGASFETLPELLRHPAT